MYIGFTYRALMMIVCFSGVSAAGKCQTAGAAGGGFIFISLFIFIIFITALLLTAPALLPHAPAAQTRRSGEMRVLLRWALCRHSVKHLTWCVCVKGAEERQCGSPSDTETTGLQQETHGCAAAWLDTHTHTWERDSLIM